MISFHIALQLANPVQACLIIKDKKTPLAKNGGETNFGSTPHRI